MKELLLLKAGRKLPSLDDTPGDYEDWTLDVMGWPAAQARVIDIATSPVFPDPSLVAGAVITGSAAMVTDRAPWMLRCERWLAEAVAAATPVLGICFGHQLLASALGGRVADNPHGVEVGTVALTLNAESRQELLFSSLPSQLWGQVSHKQSVIELPPEAIALASSDMDPHQGVAYGPRAWGIQFHPEFDEHRIPHYIHAFRRDLERQEPGYEARLAGVRPTPNSRGLLRRFAGMIRASE